MASIYGTAHAKRSCGDNTDAEKRDCHDTDPILRHHHAPLPSLALRLRRTLELDAYRLPGKSSDKLLRYSGMRVRVLRSKEMVKGTPIDDL